MNYYAVSSETGQIVESGDFYPQDVEEWAQALANDLGEEVWVIAGEHSGITVSPHVGRESVTVIAPMLPGLEQA